jgi:SAM-dependent methyltransferase
MQAMDESRFEFGKNWLRFLARTGEARIQGSVECLRRLVGDIEGKTFLDIGSGSGLGSLSAVRLGASRVFSFDYDPRSVACSKEMKRRFAPDANWTVEQGSALDESYLRSLGTFDIVYSWGVLHHTGDMWKALDLATIPVKDKLVISIYNDQGLQSRAWKAIKWLYVSVPPIRPLVAVSVFLYAWLPRAVHPGRLVSDWRNYGRGMSPWHDAVDWAGGYPFEVATPAAISSFYDSRGFKLEGSNITMDLGCNEFVFVRSERTAHETPGAYLACLV